MREEIISGVSFVFPSVFVSVIMSYDFQLKRKGGMGEREAD